MLRELQVDLGLLNVVVDGCNEGFKRVIASLWTDVAHHDNTENLPIKVLFERVNHVCLHGLLGVFVVRIPANAHHHFVDIPIGHAGPAVVDSCADISWKIVHYGVWEVGCGNPQLFAPPPEASDDLSSAEVRKAFHGCSTR